MIRRKIAKYLAGRKYVIEILENPTDLSEFKEPLTTRLITGLILMGLSYVIGWPAVAVLGVLAACLQEPMIAVIGCPTTYALSYVVFIAGAWLARAPHYLGVLVRYAIQIFLRKLLS
jgi:CHASE2 domain-containing sensor protein